MNIQGLEALATLASAVPAPGTTESSQTSASGNKPITTNQHGVNTNSQSDGNIQSNVIQAPAPVPVPQQGAVGVPSQQMWQQLMATAAGSPLAGAPSNPLVSTNNHAALAQMGTILGNTSSVNLQRLVPQQQHLTAPAPATQSQPTAGTDPNLHALSMALSGVNPGLLTSLLGKSIVVASLDDVRVEVSGRDHHDEHRH